VWCSGVAQVKVVITIEFDSGNGETISRLPANLAAGQFPARIVKDLH
jgi:hypothetical protein